MPKYDPRQEDCPWIEENKPIRCHNGNGWGAWMRAKRASNVMRFEFDLEQAMRFDDDDTKEQ